MVRGGGGAGKGAKGRLILEKITYLSDFLNTFFLSEEARAHMDDDNNSISLTFLNV